MREREQRAGLLARLAARVGSACCCARGPAEEGASWFGVVGLLLPLASWAKKMDRPQAGPDGFSIFLIHFLSFSISFSLLFYLLPIWLGFDLFSFMY